MSTPSKTSVILKEGSPTLNETRSWAAMAVKPTSTIFNSNNDQSLISTLADEKDQNKAAGDSKPSAGNPKTATGDSKPSAGNPKTAAGNSKTPAAKDGKSAAGDSSAAAVKDGKSSAVKEVTDGKNPAGLMKAAVSFDTTTAQMKLSPKKNGVSNLIPSEHEIYGFFEAAKKAAGEEHSRQILNGSHDQIADAAAKAKEVIVFRDLISDYFSSASIDESPALGGIGVRVLMSDSTSLYSGLFSKPLPGPLLGPPPGPLPGPPPGPPPGFQKEDDSFKLAESRNTKKKAGVKTTHADSNLGFTTPPREQEENPPAPPAPRKVFKEWTPTQLETKKDDIKTCVLKLVTAIITTIGLQKIIDGLNKHGESYMVATTIDFSGHMNKIGETSFGTHIYANMMVDPSKDPITGKVNARFRSFKSTLENYINKDRDIDDVKIRLTVDRLPTPENSTEPHFHRFRFILQGCRYDARPTFTVGTLEQYIPKGTAGNAN